MTQTPHYSLTWSEHLSTISNGLSSLQQNEEFVDMTLAADGHFVKVHKVVMALASPYIKELISSTKCDHPVIFLNRISYKTLSAILEYVYTGEVFVHFENINEFIVAAKDLHIRGLQELDIVNEKPQNEQIMNTLESSHYTKHDPECYETLDNSQNDLEELKITVKEIYKGVNDASENETVCSIQDANACLPTLHYTVSNRGSLQMILNKFVYYLKHTNKDSSRQWRCVDYLNNRKCPALIFTKGDVVIQRVAAHNHPIHDDKIYKKFRAGSVFTAIRDAMEKGLDVAKTPKDDSIISE